MSENISQLDASLADLGFSPIETKIYVFLLQESPATGYRISHGIGKPTANTYKAITALHEKGAILIDDGDKRLVRPVPPKELMARLERSFSKNCAVAERILSTMVREKQDDRVWQLTSIPQVYERARTMIEGAQEIILADVFPGQMKELKSDFERARARGVEVHVIVYEEIPNVSFNCAVHSSGPVNLTWPGNQLDLVVDAEEHLLCMFTPDNAQIHQAVWSNSPFLSCLQHNHLSMEILIGSLSPEDQDRLIHKHPLSNIVLSSANPPGLRKIIDTLIERQPEYTHLGKAI